MFLRDYGPLRLLITARAGSRQREERLAHLVDLARKLRLPVTAVSPIEIERVFGGKLSKDKKAALLSAHFKDLLPGSRHGGGAGCPRTIAWPSSRPPLSSPLISTSILANHSVFMDNHMPAASTDDLAALIKKAFELTEGMLKRIESRLAELDRCRRDENRRRAVDREVLLAIGTRLGIEIEKIIDYDKE